MPYIHSFAKNIYSLVVIDKKNFFFAFMIFLSKKTQFPYLEVIFSAF